jgi:molybdopterin molybdotransferase
VFVNQNSAVLTSCAWADALIDNPAGRGIARGDAVDALLFSDLGA